MALPSSGTITMDMIRTELKKTGTISLNDTDVRALAGKPSGPISLSDFYGKSAVTKLSISFVMDSYSFDDWGGGEGFWQGYKSVSGSGASYFPSLAEECFVSVGNEMDIYFNGAPTLPLNHSATVSASSTSITAPAIVNGPVSINTSSSDGLAFIAHVYDRLSVNLDVTITVTFDKP